MIPMKEKKSYKKQYLNSDYNIEEGNLTNAIFAIKGFLKQIKHSCTNSP